MEDVTPEVGVVLAVYDPDEAALEAQIASLAVQAGIEVQLLAVIADCRSGPLVKRLAAKHAVAVDLLEPISPTQSYQSFEEGLAAALTAFPDTELFALCDQDDIWYPDKLSTTVAQLLEDGTGLVHSDAEVLDADGSLIAPSLRRFERRLIARGVRDLLSENSVTGMTIVATRKTVEVALPFPQQAALFFHHDLWLALVAEVLDGISYVDTPLVGYRQHGGNVVGAGGTRGDKHRVFSLAWRRHWAGTYYVAAYLAKCLYLRVEAVTSKGVDVIDRQRLTGLRPYLSQSGAGVVFLLNAVRFAALGRWDLSKQSVIFALVRLARLGFAVRETLFRGFVPALANLDKRAFAAAPGAQPKYPISAAESTGRATKSAASFCDARCQLSVPVGVDATLSNGVSILVPSLNPTEIFAGVATAIDLGVGLAQRGHQVTFVATDLPIGNMRATRSFLASRASEHRLTTIPNVICAQTVREWTIAPEEAFVATAWWTAHLCDHLMRVQRNADAGFHYLIQDFEPGFYPWSEDYAGALDSYDLNAAPIFNSASLRDYFVDNGFFSSEKAGLVFQPSIDVARYANLPRRQKKTKRIAFYGRPEVPRNLFAMGIAALDRFLARADLGSEDVELVSVGLEHDDVLFATGHRLRSLGKIPWSEYPDFLTSVDLGLSLMLSPHPSHPPIEMAAAGARVVTNSFAG